MVVVVLRDLTQTTASIEGLRRVQVDNRVVTSVAWSGLTELAILVQRDDESTEPYRVASAARTSGRRDGGQRRRYRGCPRSGLAVSTEDGTLFQQMPTLHWAEIGAAWIRRIQVVEMAVRHCRRSGRIECAQPGDTDGESRACCAQLIKKVLASRSRSATLNRCIRVAGSDSSRRLRPTSLSAGCAQAARGRRACSALRVVAIRGAGPGSRPAARRNTGRRDVCVRGAVRSAVLAHKEHGRLGLSRPFGAALAAAAGHFSHTRVRPTASGLGPRTVCRTATRQRGHDPLLRVARRAGIVLRRAGVDCAVVPAVRHGPSVWDQAGLGQAARKANLHESMIIRSGAPQLLTNRWVVIVDDVVTTGATIDEVARTIRLMGLEPCGAAVIAATP